MNTLISCPSQRVPLFDNSTVYPPPRPPLDYPSHFPWSNLLYFSVYFLIPLSYLSLPPTPPTSLNSSPWLHLVCWESIPRGLECLQPTELSLMEWYVGSIVVEIFVIKFLTWSQVKWYFKVLLLNYNHAFIYKNIKEASDVFNDRMTLDLIWFYLVDFLVMHLQELVRMVFIAATATCDHLKLEGLSTLQVQ